MGAEELAAIEVEGVFFVACWVVVWGVEGIEAVVFCFYFWSVCEGEAHAAEDLDGSVLDDGEWMKSASW